VRNGILSSRLSRKNPVLIGDNCFESKLITKLTGLLQGISLSARSRRIHTEVLEIRNLIRIAANGEREISLVRTASSGGSNRSKSRSVRLHKAEASELPKFTAPDII